MGKIIVIRSTKEFRVYGKSSTGDKINYSVRATHIEDVLKDADKAYPGASITVEEVKGSDRGRIRP